MYTRKLPCSYPTDTHPSRPHPQAEPSYTHLAQASSPGTVKLVSHEITCSRTIISGDDDPNRPVHYPTRHTGSKPCKSARPLRGPTSISYKQPSPPPPSSLPSGLRAWRGWWVVAGLEKRLDQHLHEHHPSTSLPMTALKDDQLITSQPLMTP
jgi:hypothetical protein